MSRQTMPFAANLQPVQSSRLSQTPTAVAVVSAPAASVTAAALSPGVRAPSLERDSRVASAKQHVVARLNSWTPGAGSMEVSSPSSAPVAPASRGSLNRRSHASPVRTSSIMHEAQGIMHELSAAGSFRTRHTIPTRQLSPRRQTSLPSSAPPPSPPPSRGTSMSLEPAVSATHLSPEHSSATSCDAALVVVGSSPLASLGCGQAPSGARQTSALTQDDLDAAIRRVTQAMEREQSNRSREVGEIRSKLNSLHDWFSSEFVRMTQSLQTETRSEIKEAKVIEVVSKHIQEEHDRVCDELLRITSKIPRATGDHQSQEESEARARQLEDRVGNLEVELDTLVSKLGALELATLEGRSTHRRAAEMQQEEVSCPNVYEHGFARSTSAASDATCLPDEGQAGLQLQREQAESKVTLLNNPQLAKEVMLLLEASTSHVNEDTTQAVEMKINEWRSTMEPAIKDCLDSCGEVVRLAEEFQSVRDGYDQQFAKMKEHLLRIDQNCFSFVQALQTFEQRMEEIARTVLRPSDSTPVLEGA